MLASLSEKLYQVDPLVCRYCGSEMRFLTPIEEAPVIKWILAPAQT